MLFLFRYVTEDKDGKRLYGRVESQSQWELEKRFQDAGYRILLLEMLKTQTKSHSDVVLTRTSGRAKRLSRDPKSQLIQQLAILMNAGMELRVSLGILLTQESRSSRMADFLKSLIQHIDSGESFSDALKSIKANFEAHEIAMIRAGESVGKLPQALSRLSELIIKSTRIRRAILSASFYPLFVLFAAAIIVSILTLFVIPRFEAILTEQVGPEGMPKLTAVILSVSRWSLAHWKSILIALLCLFPSLLSLRKWKRFGLLCERVFFKITILKKMVTEWNIVLFARTFGELLNCGAPLLESLQLAKGGVKNATIRQALDYVVDDLEHGISFADALRRHQVFPAMAQGLMAVGDQTGTIGEMMNRVAETYEYQLNESLQQMTKLLEPILIVCLAVFVGSIVIGLFLPLVTLIKGFSG
ncbi:MAG: type II secretion system F family protein [Puniceicoccales bacterium]|jgi:type IV pilus assembly protein PilC|nr:type II secretion system F family protein [Puniceicoccales bacterium]